MDLSRDHLNDALGCIAAWRADPHASHNCPVCGAPGIDIVDHSARPYSEWYRLHCRACGLNTTLHIPMPGPTAS